MRGPDMTHPTDRASQEAPSVVLRRAAERGRANFGWLDSRHTFSFGHYWDPRHMGFRDLRVINDDRVAPAAGFPTHPHRDMEILTYVLEGAVAHKDSMGNGSQIRPGEVQRMTAGTGIRHSEFNASDEDSLRLLQIWILPARPNLEPGYEQKAFSDEERRGRLRLVASPDGTEGSVVVHQDVRLYASLLGDGESATLPLAPGRHAWVQVARGEVRALGHDLVEGDGLAVSGTDVVTLEGKVDAEVLVFDLA